MATRPCCIGSRVARYARALAGGKTGRIDMAVRLSSSGLSWDDATPAPALPAFIDAVLRGIGQVMFQNNAYAGLLFVGGILVNSPLFALGALIGAAVSTASAMVFGVDRCAVRAGLYGFNGALVGIALLFYLRPGPWSWACVVLAAAGSTVLMAALTQWLGHWKVPALTAPFVFGTLPLLLASRRWERLQATPMLPPAALPEALAVDGAMSAATVVQGLFNGIGQVFFQGSVASGLCFAFGSLVGLLVAAGLGAAEPALRAGLYGFNSVLVAIALAGVFIAIDRFALAYALLGAIAAAVAFAALSVALQPLGLPTLTLPFVLVTWVFLLAAPRLSTLRAAPPA